MYAFRVLKNLERTGYNEKSCLCIHIDLIISNIIFTPPWWVSGWYNRRLQPRHPSSVTGLSLSQVSLQRVFKGKTIKSDVFKLIWSCIVLHVCFVFQNFFGSYFADWWKVTLFLAGTGCCLFVLVCYFETSHHPEWHRRVSCNNADNLRALKMLYSTRTLLQETDLCPHVSSSFFFNASSVVVNLVININTNLIQFHFLS